jgi:hypothetical protein
MKIEHKDVLTKVVLVEKAPFLVSYRENICDIVMLVKMCVGEDEFYESCKEFKLDYTYSIGFKPSSYYIIMKNEYIDAVCFGMIIRKKNCTRIL